MLQLPRVFLIRRKQRLSVNGPVSEWPPVISGIPQGSVFGTVVFVININDLPFSVKQVIKNFADDTKKYKEVPSYAVHVVVQSD